MDFLHGTVSRCMGCTLSELLTLCIPNKDVIFKRIFQFNLQDDMMAF